MSPFSKLFANLCCSWQDSGTKCASSPELHTRRKASKTPSTMVSHGHRITSTASRAVSSMRIESEEEDPHLDVLEEHHCRNGAPHAPSPTALTQPSLSKCKHPNADSNEVATETSCRPASSGTSCRSIKPTAIVFYNHPWKAVLNHAKLLSCFDALVHDIFPLCTTYLNTHAAEFIHQALSEMKNDGVVPDSSVLDEHKYLMYELVCIF